MTSSTGETIVVNVRLHAILRELVVGDEQNQIKLSLAPLATVGDIPAELGLPKMEVVYSLNGKIVDASAVLKDNDLLDIIPAISGGSVHK